MNCVCEFLKTYGAMTLVRMDFTPNEQNIMNLAALHPKYQITLPSFISFSYILIKFSQINLFLFKLV